MPELDNLTVAQVMDLLQLSRDTVHRLAAIGELPGRKVGRTWRFLTDEIEQYVRGRRPGPDPAGRDGDVMAPAAAIEATRNM